VDFISADQLITDNRKFCCGICYERYDIQVLNEGCVCSVWYFFCRNRYEIRSFSGTHRRTSTS